MQVRFCGDPYGASRNSASTSTTSLSSATSEEHSKYKRIKAVKQQIVDVFTTKTEEGKESSQAQRRQQVKVLEEYPTKVNTFKNTPSGDLRTSSMTDVLNDLKKVLGRLKVNMPQL